MPNNFLLVSTMKMGNLANSKLISLGLINLILALVGFPFMHGILPHSPLHAKSLAEIEYVMENGVVKENVLFVRETRVTAILSHVLIGLSLLMIPSPINLIPISVLDGLFLFCAFSTLIGKCNRVTWISMLTTGSHPEGMSSKTSRNRRVEIE